MKRELFFYFIEFCLPCWSFSAEKRFPLKNKQQIKQPSHHRRHLVLDQRAGLVLCRHHDGHAAHAGDVGGRDPGGGRWEGPQGGEGGGGADLQLQLLLKLLQLQLLLAVGLWQRLGLRQLGVALRPGEGAAVDADLGPRGGVLAARQRAAVAVAEVVGRGGAVALRGPVARRAARRRDDGGRVRGGALGVLLQLLVAVVVAVVVVVVVVVLVVVVVVERVRGLLVVRAGGDGGQGAVLRDDVGAHPALGPGDPLGSLSVLPGGGRERAHVKREKNRGLLPAPVSPHSLDFIGHVVLTLPPPLYQIVEADQQQDEADHCAHGGAGDHSSVGG